MLRGETCRDVSQVMRSQLSILANYKRYSYFKKWNQIRSKNLVDIDAYQTACLQATLEYSQTLGIYGELNDTSTFDELRDTGFTTDKSFFQNNRFELNQFTQISTGGSSGQPASIPVNEPVGLSNWASTNFYRQTFDYKLGEKVMLIWGHSHLMVKEGRNLNAAKRKLFDFINNYKRLNAYDTSVNALHEILIQINRECPKVLLGYSSAIYALAKYLDETGRVNFAKDLKFIVCTSEPLIEGQRRLIENVFNTTVVMEYGAAETGLIAFNLHNTSRYLVNWMNYYVEEISNEVYVTSLIPRAFPLIRYRMNDRIVGFTKSNSRVVDFISIDGRPQKVYKFFNEGYEQKISGIALVHAAKDLPNITQIQIKYNKNKIIYFLTTLTLKEPSNAKEVIVNNLKIKHNWLLSENIEVEIISDSIKTIAGKVKTYLE